MECPSNWPNIVEAIATAIMAVVSIVTAGTIWILVKQLSLQRKQTGIQAQQLNDDHERSRKLTAIELMLQWERGTDSGDNMIIRWVNSLDDEQLRRLAQGDQFDITNEKLRGLKGIIAVLGMPDAISANAEGNTQTVSQGLSTILRARCVGFLNLLELVLLAWSREVADRKMIEGEFFDFARSSDKMMERLRSHLGSYPAVEEFVRVVENSGKLDSERKLLGTTGSGSAGSPQ